MRFIAGIVLLFVFFLPGAVSADSGQGDADAGQITLRLGTANGAKISDRLMGFNIVYAKNPDSLWTSGVLAESIAAVKPAFLRYPGGTVTTYFHWQSPSGNGWMDSWDPEYDRSRNLPPSEFMDLNEYMALVEKVGATPMLGVNVNSGFRWNRVEEGVQEALDMMKYCRDKGFAVEYWYLGNEPYMHDCNGGANTVAQYAEMINAFAPRMKEFDPGIKIVVNWHATFRKHGHHYDELFALSGKYIDVVDVHWYNMWGTAAWEQWLAVTPNGVFTGDSYLDEMRSFREIAARNGYPDVKLASLEWNVGPGKRSEGPRLNPDQSALVQSEMMMQFMTGGLDMATFWPLFWSSEFAFRSFFDQQSGKPLPNAEVFRYFGRLQGAGLIDCTPSFAPSKIMYLAAEQESTGEICICVLNKNGRPVELTLDNIPKGKVSKGDCTAFAISSDLSTLQQLKGTVKNRRVTLEPYSVNFIVYAGK